MSDVFLSAVGLLKRREHGAFELTSKLVKKGYGSTLANEALLKCQRLGLQSDERFADMFCRTRIAQGYGPIRISKALVALRIDKVLVQSVLQEEQDNWLSYASKAWKKKYKNEPAKSFTELQKQKQFLLYRGFTSDIIHLLFECIQAEN